MGGCPSLPVSPLTSPTSGRMRMPGEVPHARDAFRQPCVKRPRPGTDDAPVRSAVALAARGTHCRGGLDRATAAQLAGDDEAALDLILHEVLLRREGGETPTLVEYQRRFPHLAEPLAVQFAVERAIEDDAGGVITVPLARADAPAVPAVPGYEMLGRTGPGRHGRRLQGPADGPRPRRRAEDGAGRRARDGRGAGPLPAPRRRRSPRLAAPRHRAGLRGRRARRPALSSRWSSAPAAAWPTDWPAAPCRPRGRPAWSGSWRGRCRRPTTRASSTATSSRPTSCSTADGRPKVADFGLAKRVDAAPA